MFPNARIIGCLFHWKQAIRRKLIELGFPKEVVSWIMKPGKLDLLTVLPIEDVSDIDAIGVLYVAREIESADGAWPIKLECGAKQSVHDWFTSPEGQKKRTTFWNYMDRQWFAKAGMIKLWNLSEFISSDSHFRLVSRTNCALERYNRTFNNLYARRHPGITTFVAGLDQETDNQVTRLEDIAAGRDIPPTYNDIPFPTIPGDYADFQPPSVEYFSLTGKKVKGKSGAGKVKEAAKAESGAGKVKKAAKAGSGAGKVKKAGDGAGKAKKAGKKSSRADSAPTGVSPVKKSARTSTVASSTAAPVRKSKRVAKSKETFDV